MPAIYAFVEHNRRVRQKIDEWRTRLRREVVGDVDEALFQFYAARLKGVASRDALNRWLGEHGGTSSLCVEEADLTGGKELAVDEVAYPDTLMVSGQPVRIRYAYAPGEEHDGVTIRVPFGLTDRVTTSVLEWAVPGLRRDKAEEWLRALPKSARAQLQPLAPKADDVAREFQPSGPSLFHDLAAFLERKYGVRVSPDTWTADRLPPHMRTRVEVLGPGDQPMGADRDLALLRQRLAAAPPAAAPSTEAWAREAARWEKAGVTAWTFGDLPERVTVSEGSGGRGTLYGWPGLRCVQGDVSVVLHRSESEARLGNRAGWQRLIELALGRDWAWVQKDLRGLSAWANAYAPLGTIDELSESVLGHLRMVVFPVEAPVPLTGAAFRAAVEAVRARVPGVVGPLMQKVGEILVLRAELAGKLGLSGRAVATSGVSGKAPVAAKPAGQVIKDFSQLRVAAATSAPVRPVSGGAAGVVPVKVGEAELAALVPARFPERTPPVWLGQLPRFLKALKVRVERATLNPAKDRERQAQWLPLAKAWEELRRQPGSESKRREVAAFRWWLEEYRVSLFAQELGTSIPVSAKRLENELVRLRMLS
jgi:ATP-dependent helicase HrpA